MLIQELPESVLLNVPAVIGNVKGRREGRGIDGNIVASSRALLRESRATVSRAPQPGGVGNV